MEGNQIWSSSETQSQTEISVTGASVATAIRLSLPEAASQHVCPVFPPIDLQHTVYNFCYKSSADYKLYKTPKNTVNRVPGTLKLYTTVTSADILKLALYGWSCHVAASAPDPCMCERAFRRHYCQTSSTLLDVMAAPLIRLAVIRAVRTPPGLQARR